MRVLICLFALGWVQPATAQLDRVHCLRGPAGTQTSPRACVPAPRTDHAGRGQADAGLMPRYQEARAFRSTHL